MNVPPLCLALLGQPVAHSRSPAMMRAALAALGLEGIYAAFDVAPAGLDAALDGLWALGFRGANVTAPHKAAVAARLAARLTPEAARTGAVNTLLRGPDGWVGHNTDVEGLALALHAERAAIRGASAVLLGAGGAARAAALCLAGLGVAGVTVLARDALRAQGVADVATAVGLRAGAAGMDSADGLRALAGAAVVVQCTSAEVSGGATLAVSLAPCAPGTLAVDLVYAPRVTPWMRRAEAAGMRVVPDAALTMLAGQGAAALSAWTGVAPPVAVMRAALDAATRGS